MKRRDPIRARRGQAFIEMTVSLIAILVLVGTFLQIARMGFEQTRAIMEATEEASEEAVSDTFTGGSSGVAYIQDWDPGADRVDYSADDTERTISPDPVYEEILEIAHPDIIEGYIGSNEISDTYNNGDLVQELSLIRERTAYPVDVLPVVRSLIYRDDRITMEAEVVFTWTKGLY